MLPIKLIADSTCDLSPELIEKYDVTILPLQVVLEDESKLDGVEITPEEVYTWCDKNNRTPGTSAPSPDSVQKAFAEFSGKSDIIAFTIGKDMSSTYQSFCSIASEFTDSRISVIDTQNLSTGIGLQIVFAGELIKNGADYETVVKETQNIVPKVRAGFVVDSVQFLYKGGRCSALAAFGATALKLHPTLAVVDGVIKVDKKVRGDIGAATMKYATGLEEGLINNAREDFVFITHSGSDKETVDKVYEYVSGLNKFKHIYVTRAGCVVSSHCGPKTLGVLYIEK